MAALNRILMFFSGNNLNVQIYREIVHVILIKWLILLNDAYIVMILLLLAATNLLYDCDTFNDV